MKQDMLKDTKKDIKHGGTDGTEYRVRCGDPNIIFRQRRM